MNTPLVLLQGDQLDIDFSEIDPDRPQYSLCPKCSAQVIQLSEGCTNCGWLEIQLQPIIKTRRQPGEGSGHIYYRTVTRNGKDYQQAYYQWRDNGKQKTKYIPKKLLNQVKQAESRKLPVKDILVLLAGKDKCSSKKSEARCSSKIVPASNNECSSKIVPASKKRRSRGKGGGWIECKPIKRNGKEYKQYWYHYEEWSSGDRTSKKSKYIPKKLRSQIEQMDNDKVPVAEILRVLRRRKKQ